MRKVIVLIVLTLAGCSSMNDLRGHNIDMARAAIADARKPVVKAADARIAEAKAIENNEDEVEERIQEKADAMEALDDADRRLHLAQRDFPAPKREEPIARSTRANPNPDDDYLREAYAGKVSDREAARDFWESLGKPFRDAWELINWVIDIAPYVLFIVLTAYVVLRLRQVYMVLAKALSFTVPDKSARKEIAGGTPIGATYDKHKHKIKPPPRPKPGKKKGKPPPPQLPPQ